MNKFTFFTLLLFCVQSTFAEDEVPSVTVIEPYVELHTGPGRGYPVFHVVESGKPIHILKRRTNWFLVETTERRPKVGWVRLAEMSQTASSAAITDRATDVVYASFRNQTKPESNYWQWTISGGDFKGAASISTAVAYRFTPNLAVQLEANQILGEFSDGKMLSGYLQHHPFPTWRVSPYFQLGAGILQTTPSATLVQAEDRTDNTLTVGGGMNLALSNRFNFFLDYRRHTLLTSRDDNEEIDEWKIGFNVSL